MFLKCHRSGRLYFYLSDRLKNVGSDKRDRFSLFIRTVNTFSEYTWVYIVIKTPYVSLKIG